MWKIMVKSRKGSFTVEASIVLPVVLTIVITFVYFCMLFYQKTYVQAMADLAAQNAAGMWDSPHKDMFLQQIDIEEIKDIRPYWRIYDTERKNKEKKVDEFIKYSILKYSLFKSETNFQVKTRVEDSILYKKVIVEVTHAYKLPAGSLLKAFGLKTDYEIKAHSQSVINDPSEFIRNTDFVVDLTNQITDGKVDTVKKNLSDMAKKLEEFLK